jgi:hypothetical protein
MTMVSLALFVRAPPEPALPLSSTSRVSVVEAGGVMIGSPLTLTPPNDLRQAEKLSGLFEALRSGHKATSRTAEINLTLR